MKTLTLRRIATIGAAAALAGGALGQVPSADAAGRASHATLAVDGSFPDPGFAKFGSTYYLYSTGAGFKVATSTNPSGRFASRGSSMPNIPTWVDRNVKQLWAPQVFAAPGGGYTMYFTGYSAARKTACIGTASAPSPLGPFKASAAPIACGPDASYRAIDPTMFSAGGKRYLVYKLAHNSTSTFRIKATQVDNATGRTIVKGGTTKNLVTVTGPIMEAPSLVSRGGKVWLFVSRGSFDRNCSSYTTEAWSAGSFLGTYNRVRTIPMNNSSGAAFCSAGGAALINDGGTYRVAFHAYERQSTTSSRRAWTGVIKWDANGSPYLY